MIGSLLVATCMVTLTVIIHYAGLAGILHLLRNRPKSTTRTTWFKQGTAILFIVFGLIALHTVQIWFYAAFYVLAGVLPDLETALYFSTVSFTTVGYGDVVLPPQWRLVGAIESANGLLLFGWSTAFLAATTAQLRTLESTWLQGTGEART